MVKVILCIPELALRFVSSVLLRNVNTWKHMGVGGQGCRGREGGSCEFGYSA